MRNTRCRSSAQRIRGGLRRVCAVMLALLLMAQFAPLTAHAEGETEEQLSAYVHQHTESCYETDPETGETQLVCGMEEQDVPASEEWLAEEMNAAMEEFNRESAELQAISGSQIAEDGTYSATVTATKNKDGKTYTGTVYVTVTDGKISGLSISASKKSDRFQDALSEVMYDLVGKAASPNTVDAVTSASLSGNSSSAKYSIDLLPAIKRALQSADPAAGGSSGSAVTPVADGVYRGSYTMSNGHYITLDVTVRDGVISTLSIVEADGSWDSLLQSESGNYVGSTAAVETVDAVSSATSLGYRDAIKNAIVDALGGDPTGESGGSGETESEKRYVFDDSYDPAYDKDENTVYATGGSYSGVTYDAPVYVMDDTSVTFLGCTFQAGILCESGTALCTIGDGSSANACTFVDVDSGYGLTLASNVFSEVYTNTTLTAEDSGNTVYFPGTTASRIYASDKATLTDSSLSVKPSWAIGTADSVTVSGSTYYGYLFTGTTPAAPGYQLFAVNLRYEGASGALDTTVPMLMNVVQNPDEEEQPGEQTGAGLVLHKNATSVGENQWQLDLYAYATGTETQVGVTFPAGYTAYDYSVKYDYGYFDSYDGNTFGGVYACIYGGTDVYYYTGSGDPVKCTASSDYSGNYTLKAGSTTLLETTVFREVLSQDILDKLCVKGEGGSTGETVKTSDSTLTAAAELRDYVSADFALTDDAAATAEVERWNGKSWEHVSTLTATLDRDAKTVTVTGFDYSSADFANYGTDEAPSTDARRVHLRLRSVSAQGGEQDEEKQTNLAASGVYAPGETQPAAAFPIPTVTVKGSSGSGEQDNPIDPGTGGSETESGGGISLTKGVNVTNVVETTEVTLDLEALTTAQQVITSTEGKGANIVLVIDTSASIIGKEASLNRAIQNLAASLPDGSQVGVVIFNESATAGTIYTKETISRLSFSGTNGTGTVMANGVDNARALLNGSGWENQENNKVIVLISDFDVDDYSNAINSAKTAKNGGCTVYSVKIDSSGVSQTAAMTELSTDDRANSVMAFTAYVSSNYPNASAVNNSMFGMFNQATVTPGTSAVGYCFGAAGGDWGSIFATIQQDVITYETVTLDSTAIFQDQVNTEIFDVSGATATVTVYDYADGTWTALQGSVSAPCGSTAKLASWQGKAADDGAIALEFARDGAVTITGFSYRDHYLPESGEEASGVNAQKIHLTISGLKLKDGVRTEEDQNDVPTNVESLSGVYADGTVDEPDKRFPVPHVNIPAKEPEEGSLIYGCSLSLKGNIGMNFYLLPLQSVLDDPDAYVELNGEKYLLAEAPTRVVGENTLYRFTFVQPAKQMNDTVTLRLYGGDGSLLTLYRQDENITKTGYRFTIQDYIVRTRELSDDAVLIALVNAMSDYGSLAQAYFHYDEDSRAEVLADVSAVTLEDLAAYEAKLTTTKRTGVSYVGSSLVLQSETVIRHYFTLDEGEIGDYTFRIGSKQVTPIQSGDSWYVEIPNIYAYALNQNYVFTASNAQGKIFTLRYSALSYAYHVMQKNEDAALVELVKALYLYNQAARAYFDSLEG